MQFKDWKRDILTIPNLLSFFRIGMIPVYIRLYLNAREPVQYYTAGAVLAVSCLTDAVDGKIARHYNMISRLGIILDPAADKITQFALTLCLSLRYPALNPVLVLFIIKELFQLALGAVNLSRGKMLPGALMTGKICTTVLFISLTGLVIFPDVGDSSVQFIAMVNASFLMISFISYLSAYLGSNPRTQNLE